MLVHVLGEELPDLLLSCREHWGLQFRGRVSRTNVCSSPEVDPFPDGVKPRDRPRRPRTPRVRVLDADLDDVQPCLGEQAQPVSCEEPERVVVVHHSRSRVRFVQDHGEVDLERRVVRIGVVRPLEVSGARPSSPSCPPWSTPGAKVSRIVSGTSSTTPLGAAWTAAVSITERRSASVVMYRVVDENRVERATEPKRAHVTLDVLALRVDRRAQLEHLLERSVSVQSKRAFMCDALFPPRSRARGAAPARR